MTGDVAVDGEELLARFPLVDEGKRLTRGGRVVEPEARHELAADGTRVVQSIEAPIGHHVAHAEVDEATGVEEAGAITSRLERRGDRGAREEPRRILRGTGVRRGRERAEHRV